MESRERTGQPMLTTQNVQPSPLWCSESSGSAFIIDHAFLFLISTRRCSFFIADSSSNVVGYLYVPLESECIFWKLNSSTFLSMRLNVQHHACQYSNIVISISLLHSCSGPAAWLAGRLVPVHAARPQSTAIRRVKHVQKLLSEAAKVYS